MMNAIWLSLSIYAVVEAIAAAYRVRQKRRIGVSAQPSATQHLQSQRSIVQPIASTPVQSNPDLDQLPRLSNQATSGFSILQTETLAEIDLPLAASLSISEVMHPEMRSPSAHQFDLDLVSPELSMAASETAKPISHEHQSVLAEISELDQTDSDNAIAHFRQHLNHPDDTVRAAIVFELGEVAAKYRGAKADEVKEILMQLSQDPSRLRRRYTYHFSG